MAKSARELQEKVEALDAEQAWTWLLASLNRRDFSRKEALDHLRRKGFGARASEAAVLRAEELRFVNDARYLDTFTSQKVSQGWGRRRIERALSEKGIDVSEVEGWAETYFSPRSELERARVLLARRGTPEKNAFEKWVRFLAGRGFDFGVAKEAARDELRERESGEAD